MPTGSTTSLSASALAVWPTICSPASLDKRLSISNPRACKDFNEKFGLTGTDKEISVRVRSDLFNLIKENESIISDYTDNEDGIIGNEEVEIDG